MPLSSLLHHILRQHTHTPCSQTSCDIRSSYLHASSRRSESNVNLKSCTAATMTARPSPVPSKNALRALRQLALSTPTIVCTAVGGICGVATLNYDARRRVKLAESILETKRVIRSVSNGRGSAHMRQMFEAAEQGKDFTLDPKKASKRRKVRNYSAVAAERPIGDEADYVVIQRALQDIQRRPQGQRQAQHN